MPGALPRNECLDMSGEYLDASGVLPAASAIARTCCGPAPQQMPRYVAPAASAAVVKPASSCRVQVNGSSAVGKACAPSRTGSRSDCMDGSAALVRYGTGSAATGQDTAARIGATSGSMVSGPRMQFSP